MKTCNSIILRIRLQLVPLRNGIQLARPHTVKMGREISTLSREFGKVRTCWYSALRWHRILSMNYALFERTRLTEDPGH
jgi:hypothetical protein